MQSVAVGGNRERGELLEEALAAARDAVDHRRGPARCHPAGARGRDRGRDLPARVVRLAEEVLDLEHVALKGGVVRRRAGVGAAAARERECERGRRPCGDDDSGEHTRALARARRYRCGRGDRRRRGKLSVLLEDPRVQVA